MTKSRTIEDLNKAFGLLFESAKISAEQMQMAGPRLRKVIEAGTVKATSIDSFHCNSSHNPTK